MKMNLLSLMDYERFSLCGTNKTPALKDFPKVIPKVFRLTVITGISEANDWQKCYSGNRRSTATTLLSSEEVDSVHRFFSASCAQIMIKSRCH